MYIIILAILSCYNKTIDRKETTSAVISNMGNVVIENTESKNEDSPTINSNFPDNENLYEEINKHVSLVEKNIIEFKLNFEKIIENTNDKERYKELLDNIIFSSLKYVISNKSIIISIDDFIKEYRKVYYKNFIAKQNLIQSDYNLIMEKCINFYNNSFKKCIDPVNTFLKLNIEIKLDMDKRLELLTILHQAYVFNLGITFNGVKVQGNKESIINFINSIYNTPVNKVIVSEIELNNENQKYKIIIEEEDKEEIIKQVLLNEYKEAKEKYIKTILDNKKEFYSQFDIFIKNIIKDDKYFDLLNFDEVLNCKIASDIMKRILCESINYSIENEIYLYSNSNDKIKEMIEYCFKESIKSLEINDDEKNIFLLKKCLTFFESMYKKDKTYLNLAFSLEGIEINLEKLMLHILAYNIDSDIVSEGITFEKNLNSLLSNFEKIYSSNVNKDEYSKKVLEFLDFINGVKFKLKDREIAFYDIKNKNSWTTELDLVENGQVITNDLMNLRLNNNLLELNGIPLKKIEKIN